MMPNMDLDDDLKEPDPIEKAITSLGEPLSIHAVRQNRVTWYMTLGMGMIVLGIIINALYWFFFPGKGIGHLWHALILPFVFGFGLIGRIWLLKGVVVHVFPQGLLRSGRGKVEAFLWDEITAIRLRSDNAAVHGQKSLDGEISAVWFDAKNHRFRTGHSWIEIERIDGVKLKLTPVMNDYVELFIEIQKQTFAAIWPKTNTRFKASEEIDFGPIALQIKHVRFKKKTIEWASLKKVSVTYGTLLFGQKSFLSVGAASPVMAINNIHVVIALIDEIVGEQVKWIEPELPKDLSTEDQSNELRET